MSFPTARPANLLPNSTFSTPSERSLGNAALNTPPLAPAAPSSGALGYPASRNDTPPPTNAVAASLQAQVATGRANTPTAPPLSRPERSGSPWGGSVISGVNASAVNAAQPFSPRTGGSAQPGDGSNSGGMGGFGGAGSYFVDQQAAAVVAHSRAVASATEMTLRGEIKRLREENNDLRKEAGRAAQLTGEVELLRQATLLQHEDKVPIRLRELERENLRLRRLLNAAEEKLRTLESEEHRQRIIDHHNFFGSAGQIAWGQSPEEMASSRVTPASLAALLGRAGEEEDSGRGGARPLEGGGNNSNNKEGAPGRVVVIRGNQGPCGACKLKIAVATRAAEADRNTAVAEAQRLQTELRKATDELEAIRQWVAQVVATYHQFPLLATNGLIGHSAVLPAGASPLAPTQQQQLHSMQQQRGQPILGNSPASTMAGLQRVTSMTPQWSSELQHPASFLDAQKQLTTVSAAAAAAASPAAAGSGSAAFRGPGTPRVGGSGLSAGGGFLGSVGTPGGSPLISRRLY